MCVCVCVCVVGGGGRGHPAKGVPFVGLSNRSIKNRKSLVLCPVLCSAQSAQGLVALTTDLTKFATQQILK